jgi:hypothetical protein
MSKLFDHINNGSAKSECLKEEQLIAYVNGRLSTSAVKIIEEHINTCELCNDALDGLLTDEGKLSSTNKQELPDAVNRINKRLDSRSRKEHRLIPIPIYSPWRMIGVAAAVVFLVLGIGVYFNLFVNTRLQIVADNLDKMKSELSSLTFSKEHDTITIVKETTQQDSKEQQTDAFDTSPLAELDNKANDSTNQIIAAEEPTLESAPLAMNDADAGSPSAVDDKPKEASSTPSPSSKSKAPADVPSVSNEQLTAIQQNLRSNNFSRAAALCYAVLNRDPSQYKVRYFLALSLVGQKKYIDAIQQYDIIMVQSNDEVYESARYQKALAHIKINDPITAKAILQQIITEGGSYKAQAEASLKDLK